MNMIDTFRLALEGVKNNKFRSFLTLLGIIIGVSAVILMVSLGSGTQEVVHGQFSSLETRQIYIGSNYELPYRSRGRLSLADSDYLQKTTLGTEQVLPFQSLYLNTKYQSRETMSSVYGVMPASYKLTNLELKYGRYINETDIEKRLGIVVVGERLLKSLIVTDDYSSLIGKFLYVEGKKLVIAGILAETETNLIIGNESIVMPISTVRELWRDRTRDVDFLLVSYNQDTTEKDIMSQVKYLLNKKYGKADSGEDRFAYEGLQGQTDIFNTVVRFFTYVLGGIAAISLLVGGIGVMNIMLVSVKERTKEIGVRLAIGARRKDIRRQFLLESIVLSFGGGLLGIVTGIILSFTANLFISKFFNWWSGDIPIWIIILAFTVTTSIGVLFGYYPAYRASRLDPIQALKYE